VKLPLVSVTADLDTCESVSSIRIDASPITAPAESVTVPVMVPVVFCARSRLAPSNPTSRTNEHRLMRLPDIPASKSDTEFPW